MDIINTAYKKIKELPLPEYNAKGVLYEHIVTGCEIFHVECEEEENLFAFAFPTPPIDSAGLPHIIEHSVLSGSKNFPLKDPFAQLLQGSMQTFLNAMTYPDKTIYPAASLVENDFFNLLRVYADAVFFPLLKEEIFLQEGHHLHVSEAGEITHSGVVYNEMKGNYSSIESIAGDWAVRSLFEKSPYRFDSGGEPLEIAGLTYQDFLDFYSTFYHPSNGKIFLYGNIPGEKILSFLDSEVLSHFTKGKKILPITSEPLWTDPKRVEVSAPASGKKETGKEDMIILNWLADPITDPLHLFSMEVLSEILLGNQGAPLYQKIIESALGEDVSPSSGTDTNLLHTLFSVGIRGTSADKEKEFASLVFDTFTELVEKGIPRQVIDGALNRVEFRNREKRGGMPFGLRLLVRSLRGWLHGLSPELTMQFGPWFEQLREKYSGNERYFEELIERYLLRNNHRSTVIVRAEKVYTVKEASIDGNDPVTMDRAVRETELFQTFQRQTDKPEDLARIPVLNRDDIPREVDIISTAEGESSAGVKLYTHSLDTNGIVYFDIGLPLDSLSLEEQYIIPLFTHALYKIGCKGFSYDELSRTLFEETGGLTSSLEASTTAAGTKLYCFFRLKTLEAKFDKGLHLLENIFTSVDVSNIAKIRDVLLEMRNGIGASVIPHGNQYALLTAARKIQPALSIEEIWKGPDQLLFLDYLSRMDTADFSKIYDVFTHLTHKLLHSGDSVLQITAEDSFLDAAADRAGKFISNLPNRPDSTAVNTSGFPDDFITFDRLPLFGGKPERLAVPSTVGFAAAVVRGSWLGTKENAYETLLGHALRTGYLWEQVRMKGGAYGVSAGANGSEGIFTFTSYRDPGCTASLTTFREALEYAAAGNIDAAILEKAVIGTVGKEVKNLSPGIKGFIGFRRKLYGIDDEARQRKRDFILSADTKKLAQTAEDLLEQFTYADTVLLADEKMLLTVPSSKEIVYLPV